MIKILFFNPRRPRSKPRIPKSIITMAASVEGMYDYVIADGNLESHPQQKILDTLATGGFKYFGCNSMPGPQLKEAIPVSKAMREQYPDIKIIWGGYFAS